MGVESGLSAEHAKRLAAEVAGVKSEADQMAGDYTVNVHADTITARAEIADITRPRTMVVTARVDGIRSGSGVRISAYDRGGRIGAGSAGLVAERRPEFVDGQLFTTPTIIHGPADVTGGAATARMLAQSTHAAATALTGMAGVATGTRAAGGVVTAAPTVQVFVGDREITDIVDVRVLERERSTVAQMKAGAR